MWAAQGSSQRGRLAHWIAFGSAGLDDARIHDLRHSFASRALALGEGLPIIGRLLGHRRVETTARYAHLARDSVRDSAERIALSIAADILYAVQSPGRRPSRWLLSTRDAHGAPRTADTLASSRKRWCTSILWTSILWVLPGTRQLRSNHAEYRIALMKDAGTRHAPNETIAKRDHATFQSHRKTRVLLASQPS